MKHITKEKFIKLHQEMTVRGLAEYLQVSRVTIRNWARKLNLPKKKVKPLITNHK